MTSSTAEHLPAPQIQIDADFQVAITPLSLEELTLLEENVKRDGIRDALVVWKEERLLLDGHNRYNLALKHGLPYRVEYLSFETRDAAADWMDTNQLGKRNLHPDAASLLRGRRYNRAKKGRGGDRKSESKAQSEPLIENTADAVARQHGVSRETVKRDAEFAKAVDKLVATGAVPDANKRAVRGELPSRKAVIDAAAVLLDANQEDKGEMKKASTAARKLLEDRTERVAKKIEKAIAGAHVSNNSGENEWYTPPQFVEAARITMGSIDCDPATSEIANKNVGARRVFTCDTDGRDKVWGDNVWMNPPYAQPLIWDFCDGLAKRVESGEVKQAIVLVNNATDTEWFQRLLDVATAVCFVKTRIRFLSPGGEKGAPLQGQAILYAGERVDFFAHEFKQFGRVLGRLP